MQMSTINRLDPRFRKSPDLDPPDTTIYLEAPTTAPQKIWQMLIRIITKFSGLSVTISKQMLKSLL